jgi:hypothetical protein
LEKLSFAKIKRICDTAAITGRLCGFFTSGAMGYGDYSDNIYFFGNGNADDWYISLSKDGCLMGGFEHESFFSTWAREEGDEYFGDLVDEDDVTEEKLESFIWRGMINHIPNNLKRLRGLGQEGLETFCFWRETNDTQWKQGRKANSFMNESLEDAYGDDGGLDDFIDRLAHYASFENFEEHVKSDKRYKQIPSEVLKHIYDGKKITKNIAKHLGLKDINGINKWYDKCFAESKKAAESGDPYNNYCLAKCYEEGKGTKQNFKKAMEHYTNAHELGLAEEFWDMPFEKKIKELSNGGASKWWELLKKEKKWWNF